MQSLPGLSAVACACLAAAAITAAAAAAAAPAFARSAAPAFARSAAPAFARSAAAITAAHPARSAAAAPAFARPAAAITAAHPARSAAAAPAFARPAAAITAAPAAPARRRRLVGGAEADVAAVPWVAALHHRRRHLCGGSIVGARWILSSAQCTHRSAPGYLSVRVGSSLRGSGGQVLEAAAVTAHESYQPWSWDYDVSVVKLDRDISFDSKKKAVALASREPARGSEVEVAGWGLQARGGATSWKLRSAALRVFDRDPCNAKYNVALNERLLCAGAEAVDVCVGDGGGPLVATATGQQVGIVLWEHDCAQPRHYEKDFRMAYTNVAALRAWIEDKTGI